jgi:predicted Zn-dependent protease
MKARITIFTISLIAMCINLTASTQQGDVQQQAWTYILQARQGDAAAAEKAVALLEQATRTKPEDTSLWNLLGRSYLFTLSAQSPGTASLDKVVSAVTAASGAFDHVLSVNPGDPTALSGHGMAVTLLGAFKQEPKALFKGFEEMNRAVELDPKTTHLRLTRGFTMVNMPPPIRDTSKVIDDLSILIQAAKDSNQRAVDWLHIMLGDIYFETGQIGPAKAQYEAAAIDSSVTRDQAQSRLEALHGGSAPSAEIMRLRSGLGSNCTMCHAK